ncbi:hypothetical protein PaeCFBP13512_06965 [Paenibacillus sp. CFBP13512]|uniref:DUF4261 domain-containing protein n=1 Tax=Paenibacillus sp. CFBP13512 TaxID=2184007 RepID=UPI0010C084C5|nr:DUF4261 domain-containing protein [Paenibacillus sp. CFBP13512]TKJ92045.1 hypothetical protein PaeCFBP13512_06965 [Paenibacillus sp. CFBP13512]
MSTHEYDDNEQNEQADEDFGFFDIYSAQLLYRTKPTIDRDTLYAKVQEYTGPLHTVLDDQGEEQEALAVWEANPTDDPNAEADPRDHYHFFHLNHMVHYEDGDLPAQTVLMPSEMEPQAELYTTALQQSWHWQEASEVLQACDYELMLTDMMARGLPHQQRLQLFNQVLRAILEVAPCDAIYWRSSDKLMEPAAFLAALQEGQDLYGALNIRLYNIQSEQERQEMVMDSCGLAALGVPDVQCHFYDMNPNEVAGFLMDISHYLYEQGDIITDGETIGQDEEQRWTCEHQFSLIAPRRVVIDLNPGNLYYAGVQESSRSQSQE